MKKKYIEKILKWLESMENEDFSYPKTKESLLKLETLHLCCFCRKIPKQISQLTNIKRLVIEFGGINAPLPKEIKYVNNLEKLELGITSLKTIHPNLYKLRKLKKLDLSGNYFNYIPKGISALKNLEELNLSLYKGKLPEDIVQLKKINSLRIEITKYVTPIQKEWINKIKDKK